MSGSPLSAPKTIQFPGAYSEEARAMQEVLDVARTLWSNMDKDLKLGGVLIVHNPACEGLHGIHVTPVGCCLHEKIGRFMTCATEKVFRLLADESLIASWQTRNDERGMCQGSIRTESGVIIAFSSLKAEQDEALALVYGIRRGHMTLENASQIIAVTDNTLFEGLNLAMAA